MKDNTREKLMRIVCDGLEDGCAGHCNYPYCYPVNNVVDHLIANGVKVQKEGKLYWKQVGEGIWNLTCSACDSHLGCRESAKHCPECGAKFVKQVPLLPKLPEEV